MKTAAANNKLTAKQSTELLASLQARFEQNLPRHKGIAWAKVASKLEASPAKLASLQQIEATGG